MGVRHNSLDYIYQKNTPLECNNGTRVRWRNRSHNLKRGNNGRMGVTRRSILMKHELMTVYGLGREMRSIQMIPRGADTKDCSRLGWRIRYRRWQEGEGMTTVSGLGSAVNSNDRPRI